MATRLNVCRLRSFVGVAVALWTMFTCAQGARGQAAYEPLHAFTGSATDGSFPTSPLIQASDGDLYGTTSGGGTFGNGTVFKITAARILTTVHSFSSDCTDGCNPTAGLIQDGDGNFYGTTMNGGAVGQGTVFKITDGALTTLHSFDCYTPSSEGCHPAAGLIQARDGNFYGATVDGNFNGTAGGTIYKITAAGILSTLHSFSNCFLDGCFPYAGLIQASDGNFYGTTSNGGNIAPGTVGDGTIFKITPGGALTTLHTFVCRESGCSGRGDPPAALIQASDGNFYGTTSRGGGFYNGDEGTIFKITPAGTFTTLHSFSSFFSEGCFPGPGLIQASDGSFYGTTPFCGPEGAGVVFRLVGRLTALGPASVWIGLKNSDDVGLRLDLLAEVFVDSTKVGEGRLDNVSAGSSGFNNAVLRVIPLALTGGPVDFPVVAPLEVRVSVRRTCFGGGHAAGTARLWYNGYIIDSGAQRDAASRFDAISDGATAYHFLRSGFALSSTFGGRQTSRQSIDVSVDAKQPCPNRIFKPFGTWSNSR